MRTSLILLIMILAFCVLTGCAPGANQSQGTTTDQYGVAGFWLGLWHGFIAPFVFLVSLFKSNLNIYEIHNNGAWYNFGFLFGLACFFGGGGNKAGKKR